jgi:hypothetical protein
MAAKGKIDDALVHEAADLFTHILAGATPQQRSAGYMVDSGKDMDPQPLLEAASARLAALGNRIFEQVPMVKYTRTKADFDQRVIENTVDHAARTTPCWRCQEVWSPLKPQCGCVKCKNNPKYYGSDLGAGTNYEPPTCLVYAASFKVFIHAAIRTLMYRYTYPRYEVYGKVYMRDQSGNVVVDEEETAKLR